MLELGSPIGDGVSSIQQKNLLEVADLSSNHCAWGSITSKRLYWGIQYQRLWTPSCITVNSLSNLKMKIQGFLFMKHLKICPKCNADLKLRSVGEIQYCDICSYWTKVGTARLDSIMIYG